MTNRTDAQAGLNAQVAKESIEDSISPTSQVTETLQPFLDGAAMLDEVDQNAAVQANTAKVSYTDAALVSQHSTDISQNQSDISDLQSQLGTEPLTTTAWSNPFDDYTILNSDNRIDGFPDGGTAANATYTLLSASSYDDGWSCNIYNDTAQDWKISIENDAGTQIYELFEGTGANVRVNDAKDGFIFVAIKGAKPVVLDSAYADFNDFTIWQDRTFDRAIIPDVVAADISGFAPFMDFDSSAGVEYTFDITMRNDDNGFKIDVWVTSNQDSTNNGIGRLYSRFGPTMATSTGNDWSVPALVSDAVTPLLTSQQFYANQEPVDTATPMLIKFHTTGVTTTGGFELLSDGATMDFDVGRFTIDSTATFGRDAGASETESVLYAAINVTTDASVAVDSDYVPFGRYFTFVLDNQKTLVTPQFSAKYFDVTATPLSIRYYFRRMPVGADDGGLYFRDYSAYNHFGNSYGSGCSSAGLSVYEHGA